VSGLQLDVDQKGAGEAARDLLEVGARAEDVRPLWPEMNTLFHEDERARFERQGPGWTKLADATLEHKAAAGQPPEILIATGRLLRSLTELPHGASESRPDRLVFGTDVPYARFHQYGTRTMPRREVAGLADPTRREMLRLVQEWIVRGMP
jgi:phage gpG-like protein